MKVFLYTIYDTGAHEAGPLFQAKNDVIAKRSFDHAMADNKVAYPGEMELLCVGKFDTEEGTVQHLVPYKIQVKLEVEDE
jgi:hypothetical protein